MTLKDVISRSREANDLIEVSKKEGTQLVDSKQSVVSGSDGESSDDETDETSSSDNENIVALQRPQFLGRAKRQQRDDPTDDREAKRRDTLNEKIKQENLASEARERLNAQSQTSSGTNDELLSRILSLDDDDTIAPEHEKQKWLDRCAMRKRLRREALLAKQLEMEQYETNKLNARQPAENVEKDEATAANEVEPAKFASTKKSNQKWKPTKAQNPRFSSSITAPNQEEETEYSYI